VPCDDELPTRVLRMSALLARAAAPSPADRRAAAEADAAEAARALLERLDRMARGAFKHLLPVARAALAVGESDDALFFRAQRAVRRALLALGDRLHREGEVDDSTLVFEQPIPELAGGGFDPGRAAESRRV